MALLNCIHMMCFNKALNISLENSIMKVNVTFNQPEQQYLNDLFDLILNLKLNQQPNFDLINNEISSFLKENIYNFYDDFFKMIDLFYFIKN